MTQTLTTGVLVTVSNVGVSYLEGSLSISETLDQRSQCQFTVWDATGTQHYVYGQPVQVVDAIEGLLFSGYVHDSQETNLPPNPALLSVVSCIDQHYLADKRVSQSDYSNLYAGHIVANLVNDYLAAEGVNAPFSVNHATSQQDFSVGTHSNTVGANNVLTVTSTGDIELAPSGTSVSHSEAATSDFSSGTLSGTSAIGNQLQLTPIPTIKFSGTSEQGTNSQGQPSSSNANNYSYVQVWSGNDAFSATDTFRFSINISSSSPACIGGVDAICNDGTPLRGIASFTDQQGIAIHPGTDLSGYASDTRYSRTFSFSNAYASGTRTAIVSVMVALEGDPAGTYTLYADSIGRYNSSGVLQTSYFGNAFQLNPPAQVSNVGYSNPTIGVVNAYATGGTRITPSVSLAATGIVQTSFVSWQEALLNSTGALTALATGATGANSQPYVTVEMSMDSGATWQQCTNNAPLPTLLPGMNTAGVSIQFRETLYVAGPDPTITPVLQSLTATVTPSYACTKTDVLKQFQTSADWNSGSFSNTIQQNNTVTLNGQFRDWSTGATSGQSTWGTGTPTGQIITGQYVITNTGTNVDVRSQLSFAGTWTSFLCEVDVYFNAYGNYGLVYNTTNWNNGNNTFAYEVDMASGTGGNYVLTLGRGSNSGSSGTFTTIATANVPLTAGSWHRLKVVRSGNQHTVYLDDVQYITASDSTFTASGYFGLRYFNTSGTTHSAFFKNFGVLASLSGTWTSPSIALSNLGTPGNALVGASVVQWQEAVVQNTTFTVQASINGGGTWQTCTNGQTIPQLTNGTSVSGKNLLLKATFTTNNANVTPTLAGLSTLVMGQFSSSGSWIAPVLNLTPAGRATTTAVAWYGNVPDSTTCAIDTSLDGVNFSQVGTGAQGNAAIGGILTQQDPTDDNFSSNSASLYTATAQTGGVAATWTWDTTNSRVIASGGEYAALLYNGLSVSDVDMYVDMDTSDGGGCVWRWVDASDYYNVIVQDASSATPDVLNLYRVSGNTRSLLATGSITFPRGTPHRIRVTMFSGAITVYFDQTQVLSTTDYFPLGTGGVGLSNDLVGAGSSARFYQLHVVPQGQSTAGINAYSRVRLTTTDPTVTPQLSTFHTGATGSVIQQGAFIPATVHSVKNGSTDTIAAFLDDLARLSNYWWRIDKYKTLSFQARHAQPAPWILTTDDMLNSKDANNPVQVDSINDTYRTTSWILGGKDVIPQVETRIADGLSRSWTMGYNIKSLSSVTVNSKKNKQTIGIQNVTLGKQMYYTSGNPTVNQDPSQPLFPYGTLLTFTYSGEVDVAVSASNPSEIARRAALDGTSGIVEVTETAPGLDNATALTLAQARVAMYSINGQTLTFTTNRTGLAVGNLLTVFLPQHAITNVTFLITAMVSQWKSVQVNGVAYLLPFYDVTATSGATVRQWTALQANLPI